MFDNCNFGSSSGPNSFGTRLAKALFNLGHEVVLDASDADVSLVFIEPTGKKLTKRIVQRLDGIWFSPSNYYTHNHKIKALYNVADAVIFQSEFDKRFVMKMWDLHRNMHVVLNGTEIAPVTKFTIPALEQLRSQYKMMFVCSANWHGQKRLLANYEMFNHIRSTIEQSSCLIVLGTNPQQIADKDVFYAGHVSHDVCAEIYAAANWMIHLAWLDHCPNVVVEALAQGTPVICSSDGGTRELVRDYGIIVEETNQFDFSLVDYDRPPAIDVSRITSLPEKVSLGAHANVDINDVARAYVSVFENALACRTYE